MRNLTLTFHPDGVGRFYAELTTTGSSDRWHIAVAVIANGTMIWKLGPVDSPDPLWFGEPLYWDRPFQFPAEYYPQIDSTIVPNAVVHTIVPSSSC